MDVSSLYSYLVAAFMVGYLWWRISLDWRFLRARWFWLYALPAALTFAALSKLGWIHP